MRALRRRLATDSSQAGLTLVEMLVAMSMAVVIVGAVGTMLVSAMRSQPRASDRAQSISSARWVLERLTREIRNGITVHEASPSSVYFRTYVRSCDGSVALENEPAIKCDVTYACTTTACSRSETTATEPPSIPPSTGETIFGGLNSNQVFCYVPSTDADPLSCGPVSEDVSDTTHIGVTLRLANPSGPTAITISDGASMRNAILSN